MKLTQNHIEHLQDLMQQGKISAAQANVEMIKIQRVKLVTSSIPKQVRDALNTAVKSGELGHVKKEGKKPEAYFHPTFEFLVAGIRNKHEREVLQSLSKVMISRSMIEMHKEADAK